MNKPWLLAAAWLVLAAQAQAQELTLQFRGRAELSAYVPSSEPPWLVASRNAFVAPRLSGFAEAFLGGRIYALGELRLDRGETPADRPLELRVEQLFIRMAPTNRIDLSLQAGKFITPFGNYPGRSHTSSDPFIRPPVNYDYRTVVSPFHFPGGAAGFINWKDDPEQFRGRGSPIVWATPYQIGFMGFGSIGPISFRAAVLNSAPSSEPDFWDRWFGETGGPSYVAHVAAQLTPELRVGASFDRGPYIDPLSRDSLPGLEVEDFDQEIIGLELTATRGLVELRGEVLFDRWEVPRVTDDPRELSWYAELKVKLLPGLAAAGRVGRIDFNKIAVGSTSEEWDYDITRWQLGSVYNFSRAIELRAEYMINRSDRNSSLLSVQAGITF